MADTPEPPKNQEKQPEPASAAPETAPTPVPVPAPTPLSAPAPGPAPGAPSPVSAPAPSPANWEPRKPSRARIVFFALLIAAGAGMALYAWDLPPFDSTQQRTDDAFVRGQTTVISPQASGYVVQVLVRDYERVKAGQPLVKIDDRVATQRVAQARAQLAAQKAQLNNSAQGERSARAGVQGQDAGLTSAEANLARAQADARRIERLAQDGSVSQRERDQAVATLRQAEASVQQVQAQRRGAQEQVNTVLVARGSLTAAVESAQAALALAEIDLANTVVTAPVDGQLGEVGARLGQFVTAGTQLLALVPDKIWIIANFREAQTARMRIGQPATLRFDALDGARLTGRVENISPAAGSEFSVIKPDNATGNFVKVAQRLSVRIAHDPDQPLAARLRPGLSALATVDTHGAPRGDGR